MRTMMNKTKQEVLSDLRAASHATIYLPHPMQGPMFDALKDAIEQAIENAVYNAASRIVESIYSQEDMERDLKL